MTIPFMGLLADHVRPSMPPSGPGKPSIILSPAEATRIGWLALDMNAGNANMISSPPEDPGRGFFARSFEKTRGEGPECRLESVWRESLQLDSRSS